MDVRLYSTENCPYCVMVKEYIRENNIEGIELIDATYDAKRKMEIIKFGGKIQVPMLYFDGQAMYESKDIINWIQENMQ